MPLATDHATSELSNIELQNVSVGQLLEKIAGGVNTAFTEGHISSNVQDELIELVEKTAEKSEAAYAVFLQGLDEENNGGLTQATCEKGLLSYKVFHRNAMLLEELVIMTVNVMAPSLPENAKKHAKLLAHKLCARGWMMHNRIEDHLPEGMNEGDKC